MSGIQLPKIEEPTFEGNLLNWRFFWEQFESTIHSKTQLTDSDKLIYLRDALKDGPARHLVSGLTQTSENSVEAVYGIRRRGIIDRAYYIKRLFEKFKKGLL